MVAPRSLLHDIEPHVAPPLTSRKWARHRAFQELENKNIENNPMHSSEPSDPTAKFGSGVCRWCDGLNQQLRHCRLVPVTFRRSEETATMVAQDDFGLAEGHLTRRAKQEHNVTMARTRHPLRDAKSG